MRVVVLLAVIGALGCTIACSGGGPPKKALFNGKEFKRGTIAREGTHQSFLYTIPAQGLTQDERLGVITSTNETPEQLQAWIMTSYVAAMGAGRALEESPTPTTACKVGFYGDRSFIGLHVCAATADKKLSGCLELDQKLAERTPSDRASSLCAEYRAKHEAELAGLLPAILAKL